MNFAIKNIGILLITCFSYFHHVHVSIINFDYLKDQNEISLSFKIAKDDFRLLFVHLYQIDIDFETEEYKSKYKQKIDEYFASHFKIIDGDDLCTIESKVIKTDEEFVWFDYSVLLDKKIDSVKIVNTILLDLYFDQKNLMIVRCADNEKGYRFDFEQREFKVIF